MLTHEPLKCQYNAINFSLSLILLLFLVTGKTNLFQISSHELEERSSVGLNCSADIGAPKGNIKIWKLPQNSNTPEMIYSSTFTDINTENCTNFVSVSHMYTVIRSDNGALFRCSSQNSLNNGVGPNLKSERISVICKFRGL